MKFIIGIGNPGIRYVNTRHNIGFRILDRFCEIHQLNFQPTKSDFWLVESMLDTFHFFLIKPATYVNNTGLVIREILDNYDISLEDILIVYDDTNLEVAELRIRKSGSDGGHNGLKSIIYHLENDNFSRLRIGIGFPKANTDLADHVLSPIPSNELAMIEKKYPLIMELIEKFIGGGTSSMLNHYSKETNI